MKILPNLIFHAAILFLAVELTPHYGAMISGLFDQVSTGLTLAQARI
ncbi:MAG: hypothetical protein H6R15_2169 [Proteobacteria bacterium]|nr:hypothetical protein [Pseudomonadota bacterium]